MQINIIGHHLTGGMNSSFQHHISSKLEQKIKKYFEQATNAKIIFAKNNNKIRTSILVNTGLGKNIIMKSEARAENMKKSFSASLEKIAKQLRRHKRKIVTH